MSPLSALHDSVDPAIAALAIAAAKRRLMDAAGARQLATRLSQSGAHGVAGVRRQLERESARDGAAIALMRLLPPKDDLALGPYQVLAHLASGGMGQVWLGKPAHGPLVVLKTLREGTVATPGPVREDTDGSLWIEAGGNAPVPGMPASPSTPPTEPPEGKLIQRFAREARLHRQLEHGHVVRLLDHGTAADGTLFIALEYVPGGDLRDLVDARGPLPEAAALALVRQVADGLAAAHALGLVHRDIKPGNVFLAANGTAKLGDFGLARASGDQHTHLTGAGDLLGSPAYMAPERIDGWAEGADIRADVYSLGALLFYLITGRAPYLGSTPEILHQHRTAEIPDVRRFAPKTGETATAVIRRCLAKRPGGRFATPAELRDGIAGGASGGGVASTIQPTVAVPPTAAREPLPVPPPPVSMPVPTIPATVVTPSADTTTGQEATLIAVRPASADAVPDPATLTPASGQRITPPAETLQAAWIALRAADGAADPLVVLLPRPVLVLGKLRADDVDICLRNYPVPEHMTACQRLSRRHLRLALDAQRGQVLIDDLGSANGTRCDGDLLIAGHPRPLVAGHDHLVEPGGVVQLSMRVIADRSRKPGASPEAVVITRPGNRPGLVYVMLLGAVRIGGAGADVMVGNSGPTLEFTRPRRHWWWRDGGDWRPLADRGVLQCGGTTLRPEAGSLALFD